MGQTGSISVPSSLPGVLSALAPTSGDAQPDLPRGYQPKPQGRGSTELQPELPCGYQPKCSETLPPAAALGPVPVGGQPGLPISPVSASAAPGQAAPVLSSYAQPRAVSSGGSPPARLDWQMPRADSWDAPNLPLPGLQVGASPSSPSQGPSSGGGIVVGDLMEAFSGSAGSWFVARVTGVAQGESGQVISVYFPTPDGAKQKSMYSNDAQLAPLGTNLHDTPPPGFIFVPSQSRPGNLVYFDPAHSVKFGSQELAWCSYFDNLLGAAPSARSPPQQGQARLTATPTLAVSAGARADAQQQVSSGGAAAQQQPMASLAAKALLPGGIAPRPPPSWEQEEAETVQEKAQLPQADSLVAAPAPSGSAPRPQASWEEGPRIEAPPAKPKVNIALRVDGDGRVALPNFGEQGRSSQASYLGSLGMGVAFAEVYKPDPEPEFYANENNVPLSPQNCMPPFSTEF